MIDLQEWTEASSIPSALLSMLLRLPKVKFVIVTLGEDGCLMLQRTEMGICILFFPSLFYQLKTANIFVFSASYRDFNAFADNLDPEERDVDDLFEKLNQKKDTNATSPACISSVFTCSSFSVKQAVMEESCKSRHMEPYFTVNFWPLGLIDNLCYDSLYSKPWYYLYFFLAKESIGTSISFYLPFKLAFLTCIKDAPLLHFLFGFLNP